ncbi:MAG: PAS domain S-box protein, partial [Chloroflexi bacterium]|nr:PAS domain S-box protein [Chloroflexota bacterium]
MLFGLLVLLGWIFNLTALKTFLLGAFTVKANAAVGYLLAGASLWLALSHLADLRIHRLQQACAVGVALIGLLTLSQYLFGWNLGIDELLFKEPAGAFGALNHGQMGPNTALNFLLIGLGLLLLDRETRRGHHPAQFLIIPAFVIALLGLLGHVYGVAVLYSIFDYYPMPIQTVVAFIVLCLAMLFAHPDAGLMAIITNYSIGGQLTRRLLPTALIVPVALGWIELLGERAGRYDTAFGMSLIAVTYMSVLAIAILLTARSLNRIDVSRKQAEAEQKQLGQRLRDQQFYTRSLFESNIDALVTTDPDGIITDVNKQMEALTGCTRDELIGAPFMIYFTDPERAEASIKLVLSEKKITNYELTARARDGRETVVSYNSTTFYDRDRKLQGVFAAARDLTERNLLDRVLHEKNVELEQTQEELSSLNKYLEDKVKERTAALSAEIAERKLTEEALRDSNVFNTMLLQTIPLGIDIVNEAGQILFLSPAMAKMFTKNALGARCWDLYKYDKQQCIDCPLKKKIEVGVTNIIETTGVLSGKVFEISHTGMIFQGQKTILEVFHDITERKQAEKELKTYSEHLEEMVKERTRALSEAQEQLVRHERLAVLGQLAGSVSHELRNPLAVISNAVYYLKLIQPDADHEVKEYLNMVEKETRTADKIITDLLDFARIQSMERESVAVSELVRQTLERFPAPPPVEVVLELPADLPPVYADPRQMMQVLDNLVVNACQAMPTGGKLTLLAHRQEQMVVIAVKDSGVGIPPENMRKLFEPLFTTKLKGIGLGLAVSQKLAEANGGRIEVESEPGKGSTFSVYLPVYK